MTQLLLGTALVGAQVMLALAMACATARLMIGPRAQDRVLALDTLYVDAMLLLLVFVGVYVLFRINSAIFF